MLPSLSPVIEYISAHNRVAKKTFPALIGMGGIAEKIAILLLSV